MLKYIGNALQSILPSVIATVVGAYIVNQYIVNKNETPPAAAVTAPASEPRKPVESSAKADTEATEAAGKAKAADKADKPARLHQPTPREKAAAEKAPAKPAATVAVVNAAPPVEANPARDERRDANDLARAAIERLRNSSHPSEAPRAAVEAPRPPELPRVQELPPAAPAIVAPIAPLPPAVTLAPVVAEPSSHPATTASVPARTDDPLRPTPPAEIPGERNDASADSGRSIRTVGDDVVSAARTVFHAVIPR